MLRKKRNRVPRVYEKVNRNTREEKNNNHEQLKKENSPAIVNTGLGPEDKPSKKIKPGTDADTPTG